MNKKILEDLFGRARSAFTIQDFETAEALMRQILQHAPRSVPSRILLGTICGNRGRFAEAEHEFKRALEIDPVNAEALNNLGCLYRLQGRLPEAENALKKAIVQASERGDIHYNLGNVYKQAGDIESAIESYTLAISHDPSFVLSYNNLGTLYEMQGKTRRAIDTYLEGLAQDPNHPTLRYNLGIAYMSLDRYEEAEDAFQQALKVKPGWVDGLNNLGIVMQRQNKWDESMDVFREILEVDPDNYTAQNNIATTLAKQGKVEEAIRHYKRALDKNPQYEKAAVNLGQILGSHEDTLGAVKDLESLVARNPKNFDLRLQLSQKYVKLQKFKEAENLLLSLKAENPQSPDVLKSLGLLYYQLGQNDQAEHCFFELTALYPDNQEYRLDVARTLRAKGKMQEAIRELSTLVDLDSNNLEATVLMAELYMDDEQLTRARDFLEAAKGDFPDEGIILTLLARAHQLLGNKNEALHAADELISLQGRRANPDDITALNQSLELYEKAVEAFGSEHGQAWQKNLDRLGALRIGHGTAMTIEPELENEAPAEQEMDSVPILDFSDLEFEFSDEEEIVLTAEEKFEEEEEEEEEQIKEVARQLQEAAPSLMTMIDDAGAGYEKPMPPIMPIITPPAPAPAAPPPPPPSRREPEPEPYREPYRRPEPPRRDPPPRREEPAYPEDDYADQHDDDYEEDYREPPRKPQPKPRPKPRPEPEPEPAEDEDASDAAVPDLNQPPAKEPEAADADEGGKPDAVKPPEPEDADAGAAARDEHPADAEQMPEELAETAIPGLEEDAFLPDSAEISLDEDLFDDAIPEDVDAMELDGELEPDQVLSIEGLLPEEHPIEAMAPVDDFHLPEPFSGEMEAIGAEPEELGLQDVFAEAGAPEELALDDIGQLAEEGPDAELEDQAGPEPEAAAELDAESPPREVAPEKLAQVRMFDYLIGLTSELPAETTRKAEEMRLFERLDGIKKAILGENPETLPIRTGIERRLQFDRRKGTRSSDLDPEVPPRLVPSAPVEAAKDADATVFTETFSMIGKMGQILPDDEKKELSARVRKIMDTLERYRK